MPCCSVLEVEKASDKTERVLNFHTFCLHQSDYHTKTGLVDVASLYDLRRDKCSPESYPCKYKMNTWCNGASFARHKHSSKHNRIPSNRDYIPFNDVIIAELLQELIFCLIHQAQTTKNTSSITRLMSYFGEMYRIT